EPARRGRSRPGTLPPRPVTTIRTVTPQSDPAWAALMTGPHGSGFGAPPWLTAISDTYGFEMSARVIIGDDGRPVAGLAHADLDDFRGRRLVSVPFCDYLDPVFDGDDQWRELIDPLLALGLPVQMKVLDSRAPRDDTRFEPIGELAWHCT